MTLPRTATTFAPPVMEARRWLQGVTHPADLPVINVFHSAPGDPHAAALLQVFADVELHIDASHLFGPVLVLPELRAELAAQTARHYAGDVKTSQVCITSGCNQAFAAAIATLCAEGDEIILPTPWYFNHKMWLDMSGAATIALPTGPDLLPDPDHARALITPRTRAISLVTPNNPAGVEYPASLVQAFFDLARAHGIALIVDETYRDFDSRNGPPHTLFQDPNWDDTLIHLYSFSKAYRLTGHRVGAMIASEERLAEVEKFLDTVAICPGQIGQHAALWGMQNLGDWLSGERTEILARRKAITEHLPKLTAQGWQLLGLGGYFAYMQHPFDISSGDLAPQLVKDASILCLPGTMFYPTTDATGRRQLRIAFANLDAQGIGNLFDRLAALPRNA